MVVWFSSFFPPFPALSVYQQSIWASETERKHHQIPRRHPHPRGLRMRMWNTNLLEQPDQNCLKEVHTEKTKLKPFISCCRPFAMGSRPKASPEIHQKKLHLLGDVRWYRTQREKRRKNIYKCIKHPPGKTENGHCLKDISTASPNITIVSLSTPPMCRWDSLLSSGSQSGGSHL